MRRPAGLLWLLALGPRGLLCRGPAAAAATVLGAAPEELPRYSGNQFQCLDGAGAPLPAAVVNDDFCDCADGSDEPGTGACAGQESTLFYCANEGGTPRRLYASRVGDGICDCCDGSDEAALALRAGGTGAKVGCANVCAQQGHQEREVQQKRLLALRQGVAMREEIKKRALVEREAWKEEVKRLEGELPALEATLKAAEAAAAEERAARKAAEEAAKAAEEAEGNNATACMWRQTGGCDPGGTREPQHDKRCSLHVEKGSSGFCDCDGDGGKGEVEPGFDCKGGARLCREACREAAAAAAAAAGQPEAPEGADHGQEDKPQVSEYAKWMDGASSALGGEEAATAGLAQAEDEGEEEEEEKKQVSEYAKWMDGAEAMTTSAAEATGVDTAGSAPEAGAAGATIEPSKPSAIDVESEAKRKVQENKDRAQDLEAKLEAMTDDHLGYASLTGKTLTKKVADFMYKVTFFSDAVQDSTSLGRWGHWTGPRSGVFEGGTMCWGGPERKLNVNFQCGIEEALEDAFEPSRCVYEATVTHPGACDPAELELLASGKRVVGPREEL